MQFQYYLTMMAVSLIYNLNLTLLIKCFETDILRGVSILYYFSILIEIRNPVYKITNTSCAELRAFLIQGHPI